MASTYSIHRDFKDKNFLYLLYARVLRSVGISFSSIALPLYMKALWFSTIVIGLSFLLMTIARAFLVLLWELVGDKFWYKKVLIVVEAIFSTSEIFFLYGQSSNLNLLATVLGGYGGMGNGGLRRAFGPGLTGLGYLWRDLRKRVTKLGTRHFRGGASWDRWLRSSFYLEANLRSIWYGICVQTHVFCHYLYRNHGNHIIDTYQTASP